jgi:hypothetical protein
MLLSESTGSTTGRAPPVPRSWLTRRRTTA